MKTINDQRGAFFLYATQDEAKAAADHITITSPARNQGEAVEAHDHPGWVVNVLDEDGDFIDTYGPGVNA